MVLVLRQLRLGVKAVLPVGEQEVEQVDHRADGPCDGVRPVDVDDLVPPLHHQRNVENTEHTPYAQHDGHGHEDLARAPAHAGDGVGERQQAVEQTDGARLQHAQLNNLRRPGEQLHQPRRPQIGGHADQLGDDSRRRDAEDGALLGTGLHTRAQILAHIGGDSHGKAGDRQEREALDFGVRAVGRRGHLAEGVDVGLHHHVGQRDHGVLHTGGQAVAQDLPQQRAVHPQGGQLQLVDSALLGQMDDAQHGAEYLRDDGGQRRRPYAPAEHRHEQQVEGHVGQGGDDQEVQRALAVAQRVHNAGKGIVHHTRTHTGKVAPEVADGVGQHLRVGVHPPQQGGGEQHTDDGEDQTADQSQQHGSVDGAGHLVVVPRAEIAGNGHAHAAGGAGEEADQQEDQRAGGADGGQRVVTQKVADDQGVGGVVQLLEQLAEKDGDSEPGDEPPGHAVGHILCGGSGHVRYTPSFGVYPARCRESMLTNGPDSSKAVGVFTEPVGKDA